MQMEKIGVGVCPTYVGMNRNMAVLSFPPESMPHVCGDEQDAYVIFIRLSGAMQSVCFKIPVSKYY